MKLLFNNMKLNEDLKLFLKYAITTMCSFIIFRSSSVIDAIFVGKHISAKGLASMSIAIPATVFCDAVINTLTSGSIVVISNYLGQGKQQKANAIFTKIFITILIFIVFASVSILSFSKQIIFFLGGKPELLADSQTYLKVFACFLIFKAFEHFLSAIFRSTGRTVVIPFFSLTNTIINFTLKYIFVVKMNMGMYGIALSTGLALLIVSNLYLILFLTDKQSTLSFTKNIGSFKEIYYIIYNGMSSLAIQISLSTFSMVANKVILKYLGTDGLIAYTPFSMLVYINYTFIGVFTTSVAPLISFNCGKNDYKKVKTFLRYAFTGAYIFNGILFFTVIFAPDFIVNTFINKGKTDNIINLSLYGLKFVKYQIIVVSVNFILNEFLTAIQRPLESFITALVNISVFPISMVYLLPIILGGKLGIFLALPVADLLASISTFLVVYIGRKKYFKE